MTDVLGIVMFVIGGTAFVLVSLTVGKIFRPRRPGQLKGEVYECGEPTVGQGQVQFDLRFYVVAMLFVIFDVEIALLYPWARVFPQFPKEAFWDLAFFVGLLLVGYAFAWKHGYLDWTRSRAGHRGDDDQRPPQQQP